MTFRSQDMATVIATDRPSKKFSSFKPIVNLFSFPQAMKLDLEYKDEKLSALSKEVEELTVGGGATDEAVAALKRSKNELEMRLKDQVSLDFKFQ